MNKEINIIENLWISNSKDIEFFKDRRLWGLLFYNKNKNTYIRFWKKEQIKEEFDKHNNFLKFGYPVAKILWYWEYDNYFIYEEESLWNKSIWFSFLEKNINYDDWFDNIYKITNQYLKAQAKSKINLVDNEMILNEGHFYEVISECEKYKFLDISLLKNLEIKIIEELNKINSTFLNHWDFNSMNFSDNWIIDLETAHYSISSYDIVTLISHNYCFPYKWAELTLAFSYKINDIEKLLLLYNNYFDKKIELEFSLSFILKWIWACCDMFDTPKLQKYRYDRIEKYIKNYLNWDNIVNIFMDEVKETNKNYFK